MLNVYAGRLGQKRRSRVAVATICLAAVLPAWAAKTKPTTRTPIEHLIVIVGENQTFDGLFGGYVAPAGQTVRNLLSEGIINADGTPGPNFSQAAQNQGTTQTAYTLNPTRGAAYATLPQPEQIGIENLTTFMTDAGTRLTDGCEVAFFPPVTGG